MKKLFTLICCVITLSAQAQLSTPQKFYQLCKVWGYLKYHHPGNCLVPWNNLLMEKIDSVANSTGNNDFNAILYHMCLQTGITVPPPNPMLPPGDSARNYNTGWFNDPSLSPDVRDFLDSVQAHAVFNSSNCLLDYNDYQDPNYNSFIDFRKDSINNIPGFSYANLKHRMLVYFYYWNTIKYLAPQIQIADNDWDSTLIQMMPGMLNANTDSLFELTLSRVVARLDDSHGFFYSRYYYKFLTGVDYTTQYFYYSKLNIARIENKNVVTASGENNINRGDIITKIDGIDADTFFAHWKPYIASGNDITRYRDMYQWLTYGNPALSHSLELKDANNNSKQVTLTAAANYQNYTYWVSTVDTMPKWKMLDCGDGYVHMGKLTAADVPSMYQDLQNAPKIIFDVRNYPQSTIWDIKPLLFPQPNISAQYFEPVLGYPGYYNMENDLNNFGIWLNSNPYPGKIVILVNEQTQSQAEYTAQILRTHPNAVIIGSQTAGADGNVSYLDLPDNITTYWTSLGWYQADWYNPQRAGVHVDTVVTPTIAGIRNGEDEVLARALTCKLGVPAIVQTGSCTIYQEEHAVVVNSTYNSDYRIDIYSMTGRRVFNQSGNRRRTSVSTESLVPGVYIVLVSGRDMVRKQKIVIQ